MITANLQDRLDGQLYTVIESHFDFHPVGKDFVSYLDNNGDVIRLVPLNLDEDSVVLKLKIESFDHQSCIIKGNGIALQRNN